jgi:membrane-anchored protein YejM (alkaline phosphatase superfamily)
MWNPSRKTLFAGWRWFAGHSLLFGLVSLRYFGGGAPADTALAWVYLVAVYIGHHAMLTVLPLFLLATPLILLVPRRRVLTAAAVLLFASMVALTMLDSLLWSQSRFHLNALTMKILGWQAGCSRASFSPLASC